jgi:stage III sporulation protein SpoIIIAA
MRETNDQLGDEIRAIVERQLQRSDLEEVNHAVNRLMEQGHSREKAIDTVGAILLEEIHEMLTESEMFDRERYVDRLEDL